MKNISQKCSGNIKPSQLKTKDISRRDFSITAWIQPTFNELQMSYLCYGVETCPDTKRIHYQTYVRFFNKKSFKSCLKYFPSGDNRVAFTLGEPKENLAYCSKDKFEKGSSFFEFGERPSQGARTDLVTICNEIKAGRTVDDIVLNDPMMYHQYGRTLSKFEDVLLRKKWRTEMTEGIWYYGETGTGKSHKAFENFNEKSHYVLEDDCGWWDGYTGQETVIINDFRGHIPYDRLLQIIDKWPLRVKRRGREPAPFLAKLVIITSPMHPKDVYHNRDENDKIEQLLRRIEVIRLNKTNVFKC